MARSSVGLDIGSSAVRIAEVRHGGSGPSLTRFGRALLPAGAVARGEVQDPGAVASTVAGLLKELGIKGRSVHVGVSNRHCVVRIVELPAMAREDLESAIRFQAQEHIPIPLDEAVMDFEVMEEIDGPEGQRMQRVMVVAAERTTIDPLLEVLNAAHLDAQTLELNAYPLARCFNGNGSAGAHAILDVGGGVTNLVVHHHGRILFTRILPSFGGDEFTSAISEGLGVDVSEAEELKRALAKPVRRRSNGASRKAAKAEAAAELVAPLIAKLVNEVKGSLDFFTSQPSAPDVERLVLTGGGSQLGGLADALAAGLGFPVQDGRPFEHVPVDPSHADDREVTVAEPFLGVAVGLALAENGG